jgi:hypothetical protein
MMVNNSNGAAVTEDRGNYIVLDAPQREGSVRWELSLAFILVFLLTTRAAISNDCGFAGPDQLIIYQNHDRGGACRILEVGAYRNAAAFGLPNDSISAIEVGVNVRAEFYRDPEFRGPQAHYEGGWYYDPLGDVDKQTSSFVIFPSLGGPAATWYVGDYPNGSRTFWSNDSQGLANDGANWFIIKGYTADSTKLFKIPLSYDLNSDSAGPYPSTGIPAPSKM